MFFFSTVRARSSESTVSTSSFSEALASASSFSEVEILVVSSSMEEVRVTTEAFASSIVASRSPIVRFELVIASSFVFASSSHQELDDFLHGAHLRGRRADQKAEKEVDHHRTNS